MQLCDSLAARFPVGGITLSVAFDGSGLWVIDTGTTSVPKLRASDAVFSDLCIPVGTQKYLALSERCQSQ